MVTATLMLDGWRVVMPLWLAVALWGAVIILLLAHVARASAERRRRKATKRHLDGMRAYIDSMHRLNEGR